jgi:hypothetical protein
MKTPIQNAPQYPFFLKYDMIAHSVDELKLAEIMMNKCKQHEQACISGVIRDYRVDWCATKDFRNKTITWIDEVVKMIKQELHNRTNPELQTIN